jgi:hypothetical protein
MADAAARPGQEQRAARLVGGRVRHKDRFQVSSAMLKRFAAKGKPVGRGKRLKTSDSHG